MRTMISMLVLGMALLISSAARATTYNEAVNGDLSGDRANPTPIALTAGSNQVTATSMAGDIEYFTMTVPVGFRLSAITAVSNTSPSLSFIAVQKGSVFTEPPTGTNVAQLLGYGHFGPANGTIGTDILDNLGIGAGAIGFVPPLAAGAYTFWSQETSASPSTYTLDFVVTAAPAAAPLPRSSIAMIALGLVAVGGFVVSVRARRSSRTGSTPAV